MELLAFAAECWILWINILLNYWQLPTKKYCLICLSNRSCNKVAQVLLCSGNAVCVELWVDHSFLSWWLCDLFESDCPVLVPSVELLKSVCVSDPTEVGVAAVATSLGEASTDEDLTCAIGLLFPIDLLPLPLLSIDRMVELPGDMTLLVGVVGLLMNACGVVCFVFSRYDAFRSWGSLDGWPLLSMSLVEERPVADGPSPDLFFLFRLLKMKQILLSI